MSWGTCLQPGRCLPVRGRPEPGQRHLFGGTGPIKAAKVDPNVPDFQKITFINYDYAKYGASAMATMASHWRIAPRASR